MTGHPLILFHSFFLECMKCVNLMSTQIVLLLHRYVKKEGEVRLHDGTVTMDLDPEPIPLGIGCFHYCPMRYI